MVEARPPSAGYRLRKFVRRHKGQVLAASLVLLALLAGIAGTTLGLFEARRQAGLARDEAEAKEQARADEAEQRQAAQAAAAAEKAARQQTQKRLAQIEKGVELFAGMLTGIDPRGGEGRQAAVRASCASVRRRQRRSCRRKRWPTLWRRLGYKR